MMERTDQEDRVARTRVEQEHREIDALFSEARAALEGGDRDHARRAIATLGRALESHFEQEDSLYYPTLASIRPEHKASLADLSRAHDSFRAQLRDIGMHLEQGPQQALRAAFEELAADFSRHEVTEEKLLQSL